MAEATFSSPRTGASLDKAADSPVQAAGDSVLVVIPVLNEAAHIESCVRSLFEGDERIRAARVIVVDGGSTDGTQNMVKTLAAEFPNVELLDNPERLQSAGVNLAARKRGEGCAILVRCDAHSVYPANYVMDVADSLVRRDAQSIATPMDARGQSCFQKANAFIVDTPLGSGGSAHRGGRKSGYVDHGHHAGFDMAWFIKLGGYDASFSHNEDAEFDRRLNDAGGRIFLDADIRIGYFPRDSLGGLARQYFNYGKGRARNLRKHGGAPRLRQMIPPAVFVTCPLALALAPLTPWTLLAPAGYLAMLAVASVGVAAVMRSPCGLLAGPASLTMHMAWSAGFLRQYLFGKAPVSAPADTPGVASLE